MFKVIMSKKGTGKTKKLIDMANAACKTDKGNIVFIDSDTHHMYDLEHEIRFADVSQFQIRTFNVLQGFLMGIFCRDFDICQFYIDDILDICENDMDKLRQFLDNISPVLKKFEIELIFTVSGDTTTAPEFLKQYFV